MDYLKQKPDLSTVEGYKAFLFDSIDKRTGEIISGGFSYGGKVFSLSSQAQTNITNTFLAKDILSYPVEWNTKDDAETINISNASELTVFYQTALGTVKAIIDSGTALKNQVRISTTVEELQLIQDNRNGTRERKHMEASWYSA